MTGGGAALTVIRRWRCAYGDPEVALRLPPANGWDPFGIEEGGRTIYPTGGGDAFTVIRRWRCAYGDPEVALRLPPANGWNPSEIR
jgi:hypothetical protein